MPWTGARRTLDSWVELLPGTKPRPLPSGFTSPGSWDSKSGGTTAALRLGIGPCPTGTGWNKSWIFLISSIFLLAIIPDHRHNLTYLTQLPTDSLKLLRSHVRNRLYQYIMLKHIILDSSNQTLLTSLLSPTTDLDSFFSTAQMSLRAEKDELPQLSVWPVVPDPASPKITHEYQNSFGTTEFQTRDLTPFRRTSPPLKFSRLSSPISSGSRRQNVGQRCRGGQHPYEPGAGLGRTTSSSQEILQSPLRDSHTLLPDLLVASEDNASVDFNFDEGYYDMPGIEVNSMTGGVWSQIEVLIAACRVMRTYERVGRRATPGIWRRSADCMQSGRPMVRNKIRMRKTAQRRGG